MDERENCVENVNELTCSNCGCVIDKDCDSHYWYEGDVVCDDCYIDLDLFECGHCGELHSRADGTYDVCDRWGNFDYEICSDCWMSGDFIECEECGSIYEERNIEYVQIVNHGHMNLCEHCLSDLYYCNECDRYVYDDDWDYDAECCCTCVPEDGIREYHTQHRNGWDYFGTDCNERFGIELEVERRNESAVLHSEMVEWLRKQLGNHAVYERDGSLTDGFEIITHPHTRKAFMELPWREVLKTLADDGYRSHDTRTCGLHIHVGRNYFKRHMQDYHDGKMDGHEYREIYYDNIAKICYLYDRKYPFFLQISRRTEENARRWAARYIGGSYAKTKEHLKNSSYYDLPRYSAVNLCNSETVEFRLGRGTLNYDSFMAWIDIHLTLVENVYKIGDDDLLNLPKWLDGISPETSEWLEAKGIDIYNTETLPLAEEKDDIDAIPDDILLEEEQEQQEVNYRTWIDVLDSRIANAV